MALNQLSVFVDNTPGALSDIAEVLRVAHRIIVMKEGRIIREFNDGVVTQEDILLTSSGILTDEDRKEA